MISRFPNTVFRLTIATALLTVLAITTTPAHAATTINLTANWDSTVGDGLCSLREAIIAANTDAAVDACPAGNGADTIVMPAGGYILTLAGSNENAALTGDLDITEDLTIIGAGSASTWISGNYSDRIFHIFWPVTVAISGVEIIQGNADLGGGILNYGTLTLTDTAFSENNATNGGGGLYNASAATISNSTFNDNSADLGGGLYNTGGATMTITNSTITGNAVTDDGGGIVNEHTLTLTDSTVSDNTAGFMGGGIYNTSFVSSSTLTVTNSTISGNNTEGDGGGIYNSETAIFINSTISGNSAKGNGGGISNTSTVKLHNVTIANNTADSDADALGDGGGVYVSPAGTLNLGNSIIAGNFDNSTIIRNHDCSGNLTSLGYNLIQKFNGCTLAGTKGNLLRVAPLLGPLQDNGGPTWTHALLAGSPAIDAGNPAGCKDGSNTVLTTDQRGNARPMDGNGDSIAVCDMGAFE